jgi:hypothetical protein
MASERFMEGKIGSMVSMWWRERKGNWGCADRRPDMSLSRSICNIHKIIRVLYIYMVQYYIVLKA